jgi:tetratricopeptide (TPR) repeat protein
MTDFFVSYTHADEAWAEWIAWILEEAGYSTTIQAWDFGAGSNFVVAMHTAAAECERTIAVLSPDYVNSRFTPPEWAAAFAQDPTGTQGLLVPVRVRKFHLKGLLPQIVYLDLVGLSEPAGKKTLLDGIKRGRKKPKMKPGFPGTARPSYPGVVAGDTDLAGLPLNEIPPRGPLPPGSRMPFAPNPLFVGREEDLLALAWQLRAGETTAIGEVKLAAASGLGGIGKTQLAAEFVYRYGRFFEGGVYWMSFADPAAVPSEVAACGRGLDLQPDWVSLPLPEQVRLVQEAWSLSSPRLLVFDNCEEEDLLAEWRPRFGGARVLITSRREVWSKALGIESVPLSPLPRPVSIELLRKFRPDLAEGDLALAGIAEELGDLPLALHLAGSYLERYTHAAFGEPAAYLAALRKGSLLDHPSLQAGFGPSPTDHELHVGRTFALSLDRLKPEEETDALARALLARAAFFAPGEPIPRDLLLMTVDLEGADEALARAEDALGRLTTLGLLGSSSKGALVIHRLVAAFARGLGEGEKAEGAVRAGLLNEANRLNNAGIPGPLLAWQPHLRAVSDRAREKGEGGGAGLCNTMGLHLQMIGDYPGARPYYERALAIREKILGPEHPDTAQSLNNLASLLQAEGDLAGARPYFERALAVSEKGVGPEHPITAICLNNLASLLHDQGDLASARPYFERALMIREKFLGPEHPETARSMNNLAGLLQDQGDLTGARPYFERALAVWEKVMGPEHPDTSRSLNNVGLLLNAEGDLAGARLCFERALAIREKSLGPEHPETATGLNNLAGLLQNQGDLMGARPYYERALSIWEKALGPEHSNTATSLNNLGYLLQAEGDLAGAGRYFERALAIREKVLGPEHPDTAQSLNSLGRLLQLEGDLAGARPYFERALEIFEARLGSEHQYTRLGRENLKSLSRPS